MNKEDFYVGQKIKLPQESYDYSWKCYGDRLADYATVCSLESLDECGIVHYEIEVLGNFVSTIHSGIHYTEIQKYEHHN